MTTFLFDNNLTILKAYSDDKIEASDQQDDLNGLIRHTLIIPYSDEVDQAVYFGMTDPAPELGDDDNLFWLYKIDHVSKGKEKRYAVLDGTYKLFDDLSGGIIEDSRPEDTTFPVAAETIFKGTGWTPVIQGEARSVRSSSNFYMTTKLSAFWDAVDAWDVEFRPYMQFKGNRITQQIVYFRRYIGEDSGRSYSYDDKLVEVIANKSNDFYTALVGRGKGEQTGRQDRAGRDTYGRKITFRDVLWDKQNGVVDYTYKRRKDIDTSDPQALEGSDIETVSVHETDQTLPYDKPRGQLYVEDYDATLKYGYPPDKWHDHYRPRIGYFDDGDEEDPGQLLRKTAEYLRTHNAPKIQCKAKVHEWENVRQGDTVRIKAPEINVYLRKRVYRQERNFLDPRFKRIEFGDEIIDTSSRGTIRSAVADRSEINLEKEELQQWVHNFNGTINWYTSEEPANPVKGDFWFWEESNGTQHIKYYNGEQWVELVSSKTKEMIEESVDAVEKESQARADGLIKQANDNMEYIQGELERQNKTFISKKDTKGLIMAATTPDKIYQSMLTFDAEQMQSLMQKGDLLTLINQEAGSIIFTAEDSHGRNLLRVTPDTTYIENGTIKSAMIADAAIGTAQIGSINAGEANIYNINARNIAGNEANLIRAMFEDLNSCLRITGSGVDIYTKYLGSYYKMLSVDEDGVVINRFDKYGRSSYKGLEITNSNIKYYIEAPGSYSAQQVAHIDKDGMWFYDYDHPYKVAGHIGYTYNTNKSGHDQPNDFLSVAAADGYDVALSYESYGGNHTPALIVHDGDGHVSIRNDTKFEGHKLWLNSSWNMRGARAESGDKPEIRFGYDDGDTNHIYFTVATDDIHCYRALNLHQYNIYNVDDITCNTVSKTSDARLKTVLGDYKRDPEKNIKSAQFVHFRWKNRNDNAEYDGILAQSVPGWSTDIGGGYLGISLGDQLNDVTLAVRGLLERVEKLEEGV